MFRSLLFLHFFLLAASAAETRPNILFLISDDQRADTIAALGNPRISTPILDRLVRQGYSFGNAFCMGSTVGAVCAPSRAMLMTGRSLFHAVDAKRAPFTQIPNVPLWPEVFRKTGYATAGIGKWHNGPATYARAFSQGGPIFFGGMNDQFKMPVHDFNPAGKYPKTNEYIAPKHSTEFFADAAVNFLEHAARTNPFVLYVAFTAPHDPRMVPSAFANRYAPSQMRLPKNFLPQHPFDNGEMTVRDEALLPWPRTKETILSTLAEYYSDITHLDAQVGRILEALKKSGQAKNTIIVFTSDHGLAVGSHGLLGKQSMYDHSMRPPLLISGPGIPARKRSDAMCYLYDLYPTLCDLAGIPIPSSVEGRSLAPILHGQAKELREELFCAYRDVQRMYRTPEWKIIYYPKIDRYQLFNIRKDPDELRDLSTDPRHEKIFAQLKSHLGRARKEADDPLPVQ